MPLESWWDLGEHVGVSGAGLHIGSITCPHCLRRGNFRSVDDLRNQVLSFIAYFNRTMAKPFKWTYQGKPLHV